MHASLVSSRGDGESPEIQKLTAWDTCPTLGNRVSLSHLSIRKADRKHVAAAVQKTTFLHDRQQLPVFGSSVAMQAGRGARCSRWLILAHRQVVLPSGSRRHL